MHLARPSPPIPLVKRLLKPHILVSVAHFFKYTLLVDLIFEAMVIVYLIIKYNLDLKRNLHIFKVKEN